MEIILEMNPLFVSRINDESISIEIINKELQNIERL